MLAVEDRPHQIHPDRKQIIPERTFSSSSLSGSAIVFKERPAMRSFGGHSLAVVSASGIVTDDTINFYLVRGKFSMLMRTY